MRWAWALNWLAAGWLWLVVGWLQSLVRTTHRSSTATAP
jgi:hypothetical protein